MCFNNFIIVKTSFSSGVFLRIDFPAAKIDAGINANEAFLAPLTFSSPLRTFLPLIMNLSKQITNAISFEFLFYSNSNYVYEYVKSILGRCE